MQHQPHEHASPSPQFGGLAFFQAWLDRQRYSQVFFITDENLDAIAPPILDGQIPLVLPPGEIHKNLTTCERIWQEMLAAGLDRRALVVNLGGGVIGDMGGFCAATYKRGVDFVQIPTTLLAMTDASIGGKLAIDFQGIKNAIGVFRDPAAIFIDPDFLKTLPATELTSGFAEVIKHALIGDPALWQQISAMTTLEGADWRTILEASIEVKVRIVREDPFEKGLRALLNFGHTIGHAVESWALNTDDPLPHGHAVAIGMICEAPPALRDRIIPVISAFFPHRRIPESAFPDLWSLMQQDKKNASGKVRMALPDETPYTLKWVEPDQNAVEAALAAYNSLS
jgi:3-dehydroquinate synthase